MYSNHHHLTNGSDFNGPNYQSSNFHKSVNNDNYKFSSQSRTSTLSQAVHSDIHTSQLHEKQANDQTVKASYQGLNSQTSLKVPREHGSSQIQNSLKSLLQENVNRYFNQYSDKLNELSVEDRFASKSTIDTEEKFDTNSSSRVNTMNFSNKTLSLDSNQTNHSNSIDLTKYTNKYTLNTSEITTHCESSSNEVFNLSELHPNQRQQILSKLATADPEHLYFRRLSNGEIIVHYKSSSKLDSSFLSSTHGTTSHGNSPNSLQKIQHSIQRMSSSPNMNILKGEGLPIEKKVQPRSLDWLLRFIEDVYNARYATFLNEIAAPDGTLETFSSFVFNHISKKFGLDSLVRQISSQLLETIKVYRKENKNVELFGLFLSPYYTAVELMFFLSARAKALFVSQNQKTQKILHKKKLKIGIEPQYIMGSKVKPLTQQILLGQPIALRKCCLKDLKTITNLSKTKKVDLTAKQREQIRTKQITLHAPKHAAKLPKLSKIELNEYLIILLVHYKAFKDSKDISGVNYYFTILPEDVPSYTRLKLADLSQFIILREKIFDEDAPLEKVINHANVVNIDCEFSWRQNNILRLQQQIDNEKIDYDEELRNLYTDFTSPSRSPLSVQREILRRSQKAKGKSSTSMEVDSPQDTSTIETVETFVPAISADSHISKESHHLNFNKDTEEEMWIKRQNLLLREKIAKLEMEEYSDDEDLAAISNYNIQLTESIRNTLSTKSESALEKIESPPSPRFISLKNLKSTSPGSHSPSKKVNITEEKQTNRSPRKSEVKISPRNKLSNLQVNQAKVSKQSPIKSPTQSESKQFSKKMEETSEIDETFVSQDLTSLLNANSFPDHFVTGDMSQEMDADPAFLFEGPNSPLSHARELTDEIQRVRRDITRQLLAGDYDNVSADEEFEVLSESEDEDDLDDVFGYIKYRE